MLYSGSHSIRLIFPEGLPKISDEKMVELSRYLSPLVQKEDGLHVILNPVFSQDAPFIYVDEKLVQRISQSSKYGPVIGGLEPVVVLQTWHGFSGIRRQVFKPKMADVLAQIPEELMTELRCSFFSIEPLELRHNYFVAKVTMYRAKASC